MWPRRVPRKTIFLRDFHFTVSLKTSCGNNLPPSFSWMRTKNEWLIFCVYDAAVHSFSGRPGAVLGTGSRCWRSDSSPQPSLSWAVKLCNFFLLLYYSIWFVLDPCNLTHNCLSLRLQGINVLLLPWVPALMYSKWLQAYTRKLIIITNNNDSL